MGDSKMMSVYRSLVTKDANALAKLLEENLDDINAKYQILAARYARLETLHEAAADAIFQDEGVKAEAVEQEMDKQGEYQYKYLRLKEKVDELNNAGIEDRASAVSAKPLIITQHSPLETLNLQMKREIRQFDGRICNWIKFWSQFEKIHLSTTIPEEVKFDYLLQYVKPGSPAEKLLENFPPSAENYAKAIDLLKTRFGKEESLIEFYVHEILALVLSSRETENISVFYDKLEAQLRGLDSLGVTKDKYAAIQFPLVESAVPVDMFRSWERRRVERGASMTAPSECLSELMSFLKIKVESEERILLRNESSLQGFGADKADGWRLSATAASLVAGTDKKTDGLPIVVSFVTSGMGTPRIVQRLNEMLTIL